MASTKKKDNKAKKSSPENKAASERNAAAADKAARDGVTTKDGGRTVTLGTQTPAEAKKSQEKAAADAYDSTPTKEEHRTGGLFLPDSFYEAPPEHGTRAKPGKE